MSVAIILTSKYANMIVNACVIPSDVSMITFQEAIKFIKRYLFQSVEFPDGKVATDFLHRQAKEKKTRIQAAKETGEILSDDEEAAKSNENNDLDGFIVRGSDDEMAKDGGQNDEDSDRIRRKRKLESKSKSKGEKKAPRKRIRVHGSQEPAERKRSEIERALREYKSSDYVHDSDDDMSPEELEKFLESEKRLREKLTSEYASKHVESTEAAKADKAALVELAKSKMDGESELVDVEESDDQSSAESMLEDDDEQSDSSAPDEDPDQDLFMGSTTPTTASPKQSAPPASRPRKIILDSDDEE